MVYLDEESHKLLEQPYDRPWNRSLHAKLLRRLTADHARAVVFDIVFSDPGSDTNADADFAAAIRENHRVILAADYHEGGAGGHGFDPPYDPFFDAVEGRCGSTALYHDNDEVNRYHMPADTKNDRFASEAWTTASFLSVPYTENESNKFVPFNLNYYGPSGTIPATSFYTAISDNSDLPTNYFAGKVVLLGRDISRNFPESAKMSTPRPSLTGMQAPSPAGSRFRPPPSLTCCDMIFSCAFRNGRNTRLSCSLGSAAGLGWRCSGHCGRRSRPSCCIPGICGQLRALHSFPPMVRLDDPPGCANSRRPRLLRGSQFRSTLRRTTPV